MANANEVVAVNAGFETLAKYDNVSIYCPGSTDAFLKIIPEHTLKITGVEKPVVIPGHFRRGDFVVKGVLVTKHFFVPSVWMDDKKIIASVEVVLKTDYARDSKQTIILNITFTSATGKPSYRVKVGTDKVPESDGYKIPDCEKFIAFEKIN